jgi:aspartate/methionine/tyrosine aminotransferase
VLIGPEDEVLMADPGYPCNRHFVRLMEGNAVGIAVGPESGWQLTPELVASRWTDRTAAVLLASPSNPTGTLLSDSALRGIIEVAEDRGGIAIVDEIYHGLVYERSLPTALGYSDNVVVINSFSKYFGMTGWRLGWAVVPEGCIREFDKLAQNVFLSPPTISQRAALAAFQPETIAILDARRDEFRARRDFLGSALREIGIDIPVFPQGAFYFYADVSRFTDDSFAFAHDLMHGAGVAITPGRDFGSNAPEKHVRIAYTTALDRLAVAVERLSKFLHPLPGGERVARSAG